MSTFLGLIEEIPGISVDRFDRKNLMSSVYFLSHYHTDHMQGLSDKFFEDLNVSNKHLYCSSITKVFLDNRYKFARSCVKDIDINVPTVVEYNTQSESAVIITVTCVPAGHCPGSVMFLFERNDSSVLYTGDFRINPLDFPNLKSLHYYQDKKKLMPRKFNAIYLDTTFLSKEYVSFPNRQDTIARLNIIIREWLQKDPRNVVVLECSATYGAEFLFVELSKVLNMKIHVRDYVYENYSHIEELFSCVTNDPNSTLIHACMQKFYTQGLQCRPGVDKENVMTVVPSAMRWKNKDTSIIGEWDEVRKQTYNVCYSMHPSFEELEKFLKYFKSLRIHPCVVNSGTETVISSLIEEIMQDSDKEVTIGQMYSFNFSKRKRFKK